MRSRHAAVCEAKIAGLAIAVAWLGYTVAVRPMASHFEQGFMSGAALVQASVAGMMAAQYFRGANWQGEVDAAAAAALVLFFVQPVAVLTAEMIAAKGDWRAVLRGGTHDGGNKDAKVEPTVHADAQRPSETEMEMALLVLPAVPSEPVHGSNPLSKLYKP